MKKKLLILFLAVISCIACFIGVTACSTKPSGGNQDAVQPEPKPEDKHSHSWAVTWDKNDTHHWHNCTAAGCDVTDNSQKDGYAAHSWDNGAVTKQATCKEEGVKTYICSVCHETKTESIPKSETHTWGDWSSDGETTHTRTCSVCSKTETENHAMQGNNCTKCSYHTEPATLLGIQGATMTGGTADMLVNKTTASVNLSQIVKVSADSSWKLYTPESALIATKVANLEDGNNAFLIVVSSGNIDNTYTLNIYKSFEITVSYHDVYNTVIHTETVDTGYEYAASYTPEITGYTFNYWKLNGAQTAKFTPFANTDLTAACTANDYTLTLDANGGEVGESSKAVTYDSNYTLPVPTRTGYTFTGWFNGETKITGTDGASLSVSKFSTETTVTAHWQANSYKLTLNSSDSSKGTVSGAGNYLYDSEVTITANTNSGYTFIGWYNGELLVSNKVNYTFNMGLAATYTAKWCKVTITKNINNRGSVSALSSTYIAGEEVTVTATTNIGYTWVGWYNGDKELTNDLSLTFNMPAENTTYTAKWNLNAEMSNFNFTSTATTCEITGIKNKSVTEIIVPDYVTAISLGAFSGCSSLESITLPFVGGSVKWETSRYQYPLGYIFGTNSYMGSTETEQYYYGSSTSSTTSTKYYIPQSLKSVTITGGNILYGAFYNCSGLTNITIPDSVTSMGNYVFSYCSGLTSITIPDGVTYIGSCAFLGCSGLTNLTIPDSVTNIGEDAFRACSGLMSINVGNGNINYKSENNCLLKKDGKRLILGCNASIIPDSVTSIDKYAFFGCSGLTNITIPDSVTSIGEGAFHACSGLTSITIPDSVTNMGNYVFSYCSELTKINCEAEGQPRYWALNWNESCTATVVWGYTG